MAILKFVVHLVNAAIAGGAAIVLGCYAVEGGVLYPNAYWVSAAFAGILFGVNTAMACLVRLEKYRRINAVRSGV